MLDAFLAAGGAFVLSGVVGLLAVRRQRQRRRQQSELQSPMRPMIVCTACNRPFESRGAAEEHARDVHQAVSPRAMNYLLDTVGEPA